METRRESHPYTNKIYDLRLGANQPLPHCVPASKPGQNDLTVTFIETEQPHALPARAAILYSSSGLAANNRPLFTVWREDEQAQSYLGIQYNDGQGQVSFLVDRTGSVVLVEKSSSLPDRDMLTYFLGPVIGCILRLRRKTGLHAGVIEVDGRALAFIGPKGSGKSTMVAAFSQAGHAVLSDDLAPLSEREGRFLVAPGYPCLRLWPEALQRLGISNIEELSKILSFSDKRFLPLATADAPGPWRFQPNPLPLAAVYYLNNSDQRGDLAVRKLTQSQGLIALAGNVYPEYAIQPGDRARDFAVLARLAERVAIRGVSRTKGLEHLPRQRAAILSDFHLIT